MHVTRHAINRCRQGKHRIIKPRVEPPRKKVVALCRGFKKWLQCGIEREKGQSSSYKKAIYDHLTTNWTNPNELEQGQVSSLPAYNGPRLASVATSPWSSHGLNEKVSTPPQYRRDPKNHCETYTTSKEATAPPRAVSNYL